jgi:hypothetical protein
MSVHFSGHFISKHLQFIYLSIFGLFDIIGSSSDYIAWNDIMINE